MDSVFSVVLMAQRALSREMEMQADLVAVALTGSDALIHALYRLQAADEAWDSALEFTNSELSQKRLVADLFAIQSRELEQMAALTGEARYGLVPPVPTEQAEQHRLFKAQLAQPPRMWSTHPLNHEREENAKRIYLAAALDSSSAWAIFDDTQALRENVSARLQQTATEAVPSPIEETLARFDKRFDHEYFDRRYRGVFLGRSPVLHTESISELYGTPEDDMNGALSTPHPASLTDQIERLRNLESELAQLESVHDGSMKATGGILRHRGQSLRVRDLPAAIETVRGETCVARAALQEYDRRCRTVHRQCAQRIGAGWEAADSRTKCNT